jgi:hypothetical protein
LKCPECCFLSFADFDLEANRQWDREFPVQNNSDWHHRIVGPGTIGIVECTINAP